MSGWRMLPTPEAMAVIWKLWERGLTPSEARKKAAWFAAHKGSAGEVIGREMVAALDELERVATGHGAALKDSTTASREETMSSRDAAARLGVSTKTIYRWRRTHRLRAAGHGRVFAADVELEEANAGFGQSGHNASA